MRKIDIEDSRSGVLKDIQRKDNLLISFGGIKQGLGIPLFEFFNSISELNSDKIFIRDFSQAWYQKGVDDHIDSIEKLIEFLESLLQGYSYKKVCFMGNSMGGYAAILFGILLNVDYVIAFSPQTFIDKWHRFLYKDKRWQDQIKNIYRGNRRQFLDLKKTLKRHTDFNGKIDIYYSISDALDKKHSERLRSIKSVGLHPIGYGGHGLIKSLRDNGELSKILYSIFDN